MLENELSWDLVLKEEKQKDYFVSALASVSSARKRGTTVFPEDQNLFEAFKLTPLSQLKVVILGQDPYHQPGQANGLCFSVTKGMKIPPSLKNIYKELQQDIGCPIAAHGDLRSWATQGVLLLNTVLTVAAGKPQSHQDFGWQKFTDQIIRLIDQNCEHVVFLLWGANAQRKAQLIDTNRHCVLMAPHPSPLSSYRGFFGCKHFSKTNQYLKLHHQDTIDWCIK
jgi:uracil-DNA glycosylase